MKRRKKIISSSNSKGKRGKGKKKTRAMIETVIKKLCVNRCP